MLFRHPDDGGGASNGQSLPGAGGDAVRDERHSPIDGAGQRGLPAADGENRRQAAVGAEIRLSHHRKEKPTTRLPIECEYEELLEASSPSTSFPDFDENTRATTFHTTGTTGPPRGVFQPPSAGAALARRTDRVPALRPGATDRDDVYMPLTPMFHVHAWGVPYSYTLLGAKQVYPGRYAPDVLLGLIAREGVKSPIRPTILQMLLSAPASKDVDLSKLKMVVGGSAMPRASSEPRRRADIDVWLATGDPTPARCSPGIT